MAQLLERLKYTEDQWVKISDPGGSFSLPIPDGFHYSDDPTAYNGMCRLTVVPNYWDPNEKVASARLSLIIQKPIPFEQKFDPRLMDAYEEYLRRTAPQVFEDGVLMHRYFPEKGCGVLCQEMWGGVKEWNKLIGIILVGKAGYLFQIGYTHYGELNADDPAVMERFYQIASEWIKRIYVRKKPAFPQPGKRHRWKFNERISLLLPSEYIVTGNENDNLDKVILVKTDPYKDDDGEIQYRYSYEVGLRGPDVGEAGDPPGGGSWLEALLTQMQPAKTWHLFEKPQTWLSSHDLSILQKDNFVEFFLLSALVQAGPGCALQVCTVQTCSDDPDEAIEPFRHLYDILEAIRINGKALELFFNNIYLQDVCKKLEIAFSEEHPCGTLDDLDDLPDWVAEVMRGLAPSNRILESDPDDDSKEAKESQEKEIAQAGERYQIGDQAELLVPEGFSVLLKKDDEGNDLINAAYGPYQEDGKTRYIFTCRLKYEETEDTRVAEAASDADWLRLCEESQSVGIKVPLLSQPKAMLFSWRKTIVLFENEIRVGSVQIAIQTGRWCGLWLFTTENREDAEARAKEFDLLYILLKGIRICGTPLQLDAVSPQGMQNVLDALYNEKENVLDMTPDQEQIETAIKDTLHELLPGLDLDEIGKEDFPTAMPDEELYPHYIHKEAFRQNLPGIKIITNPHGTDYQFLPLRNILGKGDDEDEDEDEKEERVEIQTRVKRILAKDTEQYDLDKRAAAMRTLFHVSPDVFDEDHDRECEIAGGYLQRAYMMSALRSVAWTLAAYCDKNKMIPEQVEDETLVRMVDFAADQGWLNYDGISYCQGLCGGRDLHVFFLPDGVEEADRQAFLPSAEDREREREMRERISTYNEMLPEVRSLTTLRKDLAYVYPAIQNLHDHLKQDRNEMEPLTGNIADIVYAWCAVATAAKEPFFSEDGPIRCFFTQLPGKEIAGKSLPEREGAAPSVKTEPAEQKETSSKTREKNETPNYEAYLNSAANIDFQFKCFVFTGLPSAKDEQNHAVVQEIQEKGGFYRTNVSGTTDYLVIGPRTPAPAKVRAAIKQIEKGHELEIVRLQDVERALAALAADRLIESPPVETKELPQALQGGGDKAVEAKEKPYIQTEKWNDRTCMTEYTSDETIIKIPEGIEIIGPGAFKKCPNLKKVLFPTTLYSVNSSDFEGSTLEEVEIPGYIDYLIVDAFADWENMRHVYIPAAISDICYDGYEEDEKSIKNFVIHTPAGSAADAFAKEYGIPVDHIVLSPRDPATGPEKKKTILNPAEEKAAVSQTVPPKKEGCYIATAVYGSYDAPEVRVLRQFRDEKMRRTLLGRIFIRLYYQLSPSVAERLKNARRVNAVVKRLLDRWVARLEKR